MDLAALGAAIAAAVTAATGVTNVAWEGTAAGSRWGAGTVIDLRLSSLRHIGQDETQYTYDAGLDTVSVAQVGQRQLGVRVRIETSTQALGSSAQAVASLLRTRLFREGVLENLRTAGLGIVRLEPTVFADYHDSDRLVSVAILDVVFSCFESDTDTDNPGDIAESAGVSSHYLTHDGVTPAALQVDFVTNE